jgi:hypothetical protein
MSWYLQIEVRILRFIQTRLVYISYFTCIPFDPITRIFSTNPPACWYDDLTSRNPRINLSIRIPPWTNIIRQDAPSQMLSHLLYTRSIQSLIVHEVAL